MADSAIGSMSESGEMEESDYGGSTTEDDESMSGRASVSSSTSGTSARHQKMDKSPSSNLLLASSHPHMPPTGLGLAAAFHAQTDGRRTSDLQIMSTSVSDDEALQPHKMSDGSEGTSLNFRKSMEMESVWIQHIEALQTRCNQLISDKKALKEKLESFGVPEQQEEKLKDMTQKIIALRKEKEELAIKMEEEEEYLINELNRKMQNLQQEKENFERNMEKEHHDRVLELQQRIIALEKETANKQSFVFQLRKEKVDLENQLEQEQESLLNHLRRRILKLEEEKRELMKMLRNRSSSTGSTSSGCHTPLEDVVMVTNMDIDVTSSPQLEKKKTSSSSSSSSRSQQGGGEKKSRVSSEKSRVSSEKSRVSSGGGDDKTSPVIIAELQQEVKRLKGMLAANEIANAERMSLLTKEERHLRAENVRLQRKLQMENQKRLEFCRTMSESESSLEMEDERQFNQQGVRGRTSSSPVTGPPRSSPIPLSSTSGGRAASPPPPAVIPGLARSVDSGGMRCLTCGSLVPLPSMMMGGAGGAGGAHHTTTRVVRPTSLITSDDNARPKRSSQLLP